MELSLWITAKKKKKLANPFTGCQHVSVFPVLGKVEEIVLKKKKTLWPLFYGWGSTASRLQPL